MDYSEDENENAHSDKLIPEWGRNADDQIIVIGVLLAAAFFAFLGWNSFRGDDEVAAGVDTTISEAAPPASEVEDSDEDDVTEETSKDPVDLTGNVQTAVKDLPGEINGVSEGSVAVLEGFVANDGERTEAGEKALEVTGIESVDNRLALLEPAVVTELDNSDVSDAGATGVGTKITVTGEVESEDARATAIKSARSVPGVSSVVDQLTIAEQPAAEPEETETEVANIAEKLNDLPQVQFDYNSADILAESFGDLDKAAELLSEIDADYEGTIEIQGYTDTVGNAAANQRLSEQRSESVRTYLIEKGVSETLITSKGFGPTNQFGDDLAANRLVRFEPVNG